MYKAIEVLLPARFLTTTAHLITTLTILYDVDDITRRALGKDESFSSEKDQLFILSWASVACFILEFICMFGGISIFLNNVTCLHVAAHFVGTICVGLFVAEEWALDSYIYFFTLFSAIPAFVELVVGFAIFQLKLLEYS